MYRDLFPGKDEIPVRIIPGLVAINHLTIYTVFSDGEIAGAAFMCRNSLEYLFVSPKIRSKGVGTLILQAVLSKLRQYSSSSEHSFLLLECKQELVSYYKRFGGYLLGTRRFFNEREEYLQMRIPLK